VDLIRPPRLHPGDRVRVVAASGPVHRERFAAGVAAVADHYELIFDETALFARRGFLAGDDRHRLQQLDDAIADPECRAVFLARGGYGLTRILPSIDRVSLRQHAKPVIGYSDVTALLSLCLKAGVIAVHGPMISDFGGLSDHDRQSLFTLLENPDPGVLLTDLEELVPGRCTGSLIGGNLEILTRLLGTPLQPSFTDTVLFLEEIGEAPYRIDRSLTHLELAGVFDAVVGIVVGDFTDCENTDDEDSDQPSSRDVLIERLGRLLIPVVLDGGFGHGQRKAALPYGSRVELDTAASHLVALEGAVS
jgi:muramoyltetrapeptide carboxypeptidase